MENILIKQNLNLQAFQKEKFGTIRTVILNGDPWFIAADVCKILSISNPTDALNKGLKEFEKARLNLGLRGGDTNIISESGFYTLVLRSRKPVADNMTLTTRQQQRIYKAAKDRINHLLGGAHSKEYKDNSKSYFINLWNSLKSKFGCGSSYKDLNPVYFEDAMEFIGQWEYVEN